MKKYRKKPMVIEAIQFRDNREFFYELKSQNIPILYDYQHTPRCFIETPEGNMYISDGDWIIKGVKGEYYPCKPDIFEMTYEEVKE